MDQLKASGAWAVSARFGECRRASDIGENMSAVANDDTGQRARAARPVNHVPTRLKVAGIAARSVFLVVLAVIVARVSTPQATGSVWQAHASLADFSRVTLGLGACLWVLSQLFVVPKDAHEHKTWLVLGPALVCFLTVCAVAWW